MHKAIVDLHSDKLKPPRFCDVEIKDNKTYLIKKIGKNYERILWEDVVYQVEAAQEGCIE